MPIRLQQAETQCADARLRATLPVPGKERELSERGLGADARERLRRERAVRAQLREPWWRHACKRGAPAPQRGRCQVPHARASALQRTRLRLGSSAEEAHSAARGCPTAEVAFGAVTPSTAPCVCVAFGRLVLRRLGPRYPLGTRARGHAATRPRGHASPWLRPERVTIRAGKKIVTVIELRRVHDR